MSNETKSVNYSSLIRYTNKLKPLVVTDASIVDTNKLELKFLDNDTKQLQLPSGGGGSLPTRSVTRIPMYFEIHFRLCEHGEYDSLDEKLDIPLSVAKDIIKIHSVTGEITKELGFTVVSDVTETKKRDDYDTVFLAVVNCNPMDSCMASYRLFVTIDSSFGFFNLQTAPFVSSINSSLVDSNDDPVELPEPFALPETIPCQVIRSSQSSREIERSSGQYTRNYYELTAYINTSGFAVSIYGEAIYNETVGIAHETGTADFRLILDNASYDDTPYTFTETVIQ